MIGLPVNHHHATHPDPTDAVVPWAIGLVDALMPLTLRVRTESDLADVCRRRPDWASVFFAGVISDLMLTLPEDDPWRLMSARLVDAVNGHDLTRGITPRPPDATGAVLPDGTALGARRRGVSDFPDGDLDYAALAEPISPEGAALVALACDGFGQARDAMDMLRGTAIVAEAQHNTMAGQHQLSAAAADVVFTAATEAVRWAAHRRRMVRAFQPDEITALSVDLFPRDSCLAWTRRTDLILAERADETMTDGIIADLLAESLVSPVADFE